MAHGSPQDDMAGTHHPNRTQAMRVARGLKRTELAERLGCHSSQVFKLEKGDVPLTLDWLYRLAQALDCFPCELLQDWEDPNHRFGLLTRLWSMMSAEEQRAFPAIIGDADPDNYKKYPISPQAREPLVEISFGPDGTYRAVVYPPDVSRKETRPTLTNDNQTKKAK